LTEADTLHCPSELFGQRLHCLPKAVSRFALVEAGYEVDLGKSISIKDENEVHVSSNKNPQEVSPAKALIDAHAGC
jgi:hypothetical protein